MRLSTRVTISVATLAAATVFTGAVRSEEKAPAKAPAIEGAWTGTWGPYFAVKPDQKEGSPEAKKAAFYAQLQKQLDCKVTALPSGEFEATFTGDAGRPYKYTIKMVGRPAGGSVLFKGTTDLGEKDGGVYDWIGRCTEKEFLGFYTSSSHTGTFTLARPK